MLIQINDPDKRMYYELESVNNGWTARETKREFDEFQFIERHRITSEGAGGSPATSPQRGRERFTRTSEGRSRASRNGGGAP